MPTSSRSLHRAPSIALTGLGLALLAALPAHANGPNLVANPGFETGDFTDWTTTPAAAGSNFGVTGNNPHSGTYNAEFGAVLGLDDSISQNLTTVAGDNYAISFWLELNDRTGSEFDASFGGTQLLKLQQQPQFAYTQYTFTEVATGTSTLVDL